GNAPSKLDRPPRPRGDAPGSGYSVPTTAAGQARASTRACHSLILPWASITTPTRWAPFWGSTLAPYAVPMVRSVSQISGKLKWFFSANLLFSAGVSNDTPRITALFRSYSAFKSRNPQPSAVQPGVSALGKNQSTTGLPLKSASLTVWPLWSCPTKSGALSPALSIETLLWSSDYRDTPSPLRLSARGRSRPRTPPAPPSRMAPRAPRC